MGEKGCATYGRNGVGRDLSARELELQPLELEALLDEHRHVARAERVGAGLGLARTRRRLVELCDESSRSCSCRLVRFERLRSDRLRSGPLGVGAPRGAHARALAPPRIARGLEVLARLGTEGWGGLSEWGG